MTAPRLTVKDETFVIVPLAEYDALCRVAQLAEDAEDEAIAREAHSAYCHAVAREEDLTMPARDWSRIRSGEHPIRVIREFRGLTQSGLAKLSGVDQPQISAIENGRRLGTVRTYLAHAKALRAPIEALVDDH